MSMIYIKRQAINAEDVNRIVLEVTRKLNDIGIPQVSTLVLSDIVEFHVTKQHKLAAYKVITEIITEFHMGKLGGEQS